MAMRISQPNQHNGGVAFHSIRDIKTVRTTSASKMIEKADRLEEWYNQHFSCLKRLNRDILDKYFKNNGRYITNEDLRDNLEQIQTLLEIWNDMPENDDGNDNDTDEPKEKTLYELLKLSGETFMYNPVDTNLDLAISLLQHATNIGRVIFSSNSLPSNESMFVTFAELGIACYKKDMVSESIEHLQMAQFIGEDLFDRYRRSKEGDDAVIADKNEFLPRMIAVCTTLGELLSTVGNIDSAIGVYQQAAKYFDYDALELEHFEEMLRLMVDEVGTLSLENGTGPVDDGVLEHVKLGVTLRESHLGQHNPEMVSSLIILRDLYLRNGDRSSASEISERIGAISQSASGDKGVSSSCGMIE